MLQFNADVYLEKGKYNCVQVKVLTENFKIRAHTEQAVHSATSSAKSPK